MNKPSRGIVVANVNHEAGVRVEPKIGEPVGRLSKVNGGG